MLHAPISPFKFVDECGDCQGGREASVLNDCPAAAWIEPHSFLSVSVKSGRSE